MKARKITFLAHVIVGTITGAPLLLAPGRFLGWIGWAPIDPILSRLLGAALLALAWSSFRGWQAADEAQMVILLELEAAFTVLGCVGLLRHLLTSRYPAMVWITFAVLAAFATAWIVFLAMGRRSQQAG
jgi:hypothetical protein